MSAAMLAPRPEIRMATRLFCIGPPSRLSLSHRWYGRIGCRAIARLSSARRWLPLRLLFQQTTAFNIGVGGNGDRFDPPTARSALLPGPLPQFDTHLVSP